MNRAAYILLLACVLNATTPDVDRATALADDVWPEGDGEGASGTVVGSIVPQAGSQEPRGAVHGALDEGRRDPVVGAMPAGEGGTDSEGRVLKGGTASPAADVGGGATAP